MRGESIQLRPHRFRSRVFTATVRPLREGIGGRGSELILASYRPGFQVRQFLSGCGLGGQAQAATSGGIAGSEAFTTPHHASRGVYRT